MAGEKDDSRDDESSDGIPDTFPGNPFLDSNKGAEVLKRFQSAMAGLPCQIQAPRFGVDADLLIDRGFNQEIADLRGGLRVDYMSSGRLPGVGRWSGDVWRNANTNPSPGQSGDLPGLSDAPTIEDVFAGLRAELAGAVRAGAENLEQSAVFLDRKGGRDRLVVKPHGSIELDPEKDNG